MSNLQLFRISTPFIALGVLLLFLLQAGHYAAGTPRFDPLAYIERGDQVTARYDAYNKALAKYYAALLAAVKEHAPDLLANLQPREPILQGYQILPLIVSDAPTETRDSVSPVAYSWPWTDRLIDSEQWQTADAESELRRATGMDPEQRRAVLEKLALNYRLQSEQLRNIHAHIQYNRLWQAAIAADPSGYNRETALYGQVVERQKVVERLQELKTTHGAGDMPLRLAESAPRLRKREFLLTRSIDQATAQVQSPPFLSIENSNGEWIVRVPVTTDIDEPEYVTAIKRIIEDSWRLQDGRKKYRVELDITTISTEDLYGVADKPVAGKKLDLKRHLERFPSGAAIVTSGALTTHVQKNAIVLGPHPIEPRVLAHEFGHILGFRDLYIRGYKNLGENGFQILEAIADRRDIMAATPGGVVLPDHFARLISSRGSRVRKL